MTIGSRAWMQAFRNAYIGPTVPGTRVSLGGRLHDATVSARLKPGSRAYRAAVVVASTLHSGGAGRTEAPDTVVSSGA